MKLIFDASSIFEALTSRQVLLVFNQTTLDFTRYELLNVIWKHTALLKTLSEADSQKLTSSLVSLLREMDLTSISGLESNILQSALEYRLSVYDMVYLSLALEHGFTLITEDQKQRKIAEKMGVPSHSYRELLDLHLA